LLIHSPLVGPFTFGPLATELRRRGHVVVVPDLRPALTAHRPLWRAIVDLAAAASEATDVINVIVGHSGAGVLLPLLSQRLDPTAVVFADAIVPGSGPTHEPGGRFTDFIDALPNDGPLLPRWPDWWGDEVMARLIPDDDMRRQITDDSPRVPRSFYDDPVPLPTGWMHRAGQCCLQLSPAYDDERERAEGYGWPSAVLDGQHLDIAVRPGEVADALLALVERTN